MAAPALIPRAERVAHFEQDGMLWSHRAPDALLSTWLKEIERSFVVLLADIGFDLSLSFSRSMD